MDKPHTLIEQKDLPNHQTWTSPNQKRLGKPSQIGKNLNFVLFLTTSKR
jgi:hypothetical protein